MSSTRILLSILSAIILMSTTCSKDDPNAGCILTATITLTPGVSGFNELEATGHDGLEPYTYLWSDGQTTQSINGSVTMDYDVTITDDLGCTATAHVASTECPDEVTDVDGNVYTVVKIGSHCWTVENLRTEHYKDGTSIGETEDSTSWVSNFNSGFGFAEWCYYKGDAGNDNTYGKLYNWFAVDNDKGLAPEGWHVATYEDYLDAINALGGLTVTGGKMKATTLWFPPNTGADNSSGFTALPGGLRWEDGHFSDLTFQAFFWNDNIGSGENAKYINLFYNNATVLPDQCSKYLGFSVRCVKD